MKEMYKSEVLNLQLNLLKSVDCWCRKHKCSYFLAYGTLLGAVRHKGYIPWDDDIDICMFRNDYNIFIREFNKNRKDNIRVLHSSIDPKFPYEFAKVHDLSTKLVENADISYSIGVNIDIFVLDPISNRKKDYTRIKMKNAIPILIFNCKNLLDNKRAAAIGRPRTGLKKMIVACAKKVCNFVSVHWCTNQLEKHAKMFSDNPSSDWVADICQRWFKETEIIKKEWFDNPVELEFEGHKFFVPSNYDAVLTAWYGDYMQLPPEEERVTHHDYKAYQL